MITYKSRTNYFLFLFLHKTSQSHLERVGTISGLTNQHHNFYSLKEVPWLEASRTIRDGCSSPTTELLWLRPAHYPLCLAPSTGMTLLFHTSPLLKEESLYFCVYVRVGRNTPLSANPPAIRFVQTAHQYGTQCSISLWIGIEARKLFAESPQKIRCVRFRCDIFSPVWCHRFFFGFLCVAS